MRNDPGRGFESHPITPAVTNRPIATQLGHSVTVSTRLFDSRSLSSSLDVPAILGNEMRFKKHIDESCFWKVENEGFDAVSSGYASPSDMLMYQKDIDLVQDAIAIVESYIASIIDEYESRQENGDYENLEEE